MTKPFLLLAMDRAPSGRRYDAQGFLHLDASNISKANVCPYYGREIPGWQEMGLDGDRVYRLLRHPDELAKAAPTFNNLPILSEHVPVDADEIPDEIIMGSTGSHATFASDYLSNSLALWKREAITGVESNRKRQLSSAYRYRADMTAGNYRGMQYDGIMRDIVGNHVALVIEGRAGPDVLVGDENTMKTRTALMVSGAVAGLVRPLLAQDAKIDLAAALADVSAGTLGDGKSLAETIHAAAAPLLAADKALTVEEIQTVIQAVPAVAIAEDALTVQAAPPAAPAPSPASSPAPVVALDEAAVQQRIDAAVLASDQRFAAIRTAEREVFPHIGEVVALDSAAAYYEMALDAAKVDHTGITDPAALRAMVKMLPAPGALIAEDKAFSDAADDKLFEGATRLIRSN
jgi:hypothetical protein